MTGGKYWIAGMKPRDKKSKTTLHEKGEFDAQAFLDSAVSQEESKSSKKLRSSTLKAMLLQVDVEGTA
jgi:hypothetical protein